ncbi:MAG: hypothetical protein Q9219_000515 [cf. Caloplaca sp. 3 TL-2023]
MQYISYSTGRYRLLDQGQAVDEYPDCASSPSNRPHATVIRIICFTVVKIDPATSLLTMDGSPASQLPDPMPSPTLTNPDMILPDHQPEQNSPSPHRLPTLPQWHRAPTEDDRQMKSAMRNLFGNGHRLRHRNSEKSLKSQETADTTRPQSKQSEVSQRSVNSALASSPLLHEESGFKKMAGRSARQTTSDTFDALDDGSVISESISPLVDAEREEYMMSEHGGINGYKFSDRFRKAIVEDDDEAYSHAAMSVRAEEILANAKKRLNEMESNLNRARHTITRPSSSMSSFLTTSSDPPSMYTLPKTLSPSKHRQQDSPPSNSKGHSRVFSETSVPSSMQTLPPNEDNHPDGVRSSSAMGPAHKDGTAAGTKHGSESRDWFWAGLTRHPSHGARHNNYGLQPLNEDGPPPSTFESPERQQSPPIADNDPVTVSTPQNQPDHPASESSANGLSRTRSTNQMRDIRDQMQDLKGKISNLKQRAREDSLRRRSLQSLRTPSPFTAAEQWYAGASGYKRERSRSKPREGSPPAIQPVIDEEDENKQYPVQEPAPEAEKETEPTANGLILASDGSQSHTSVTDGPVLRESDDSPMTVVDVPSPEKDRIIDQADSEVPPESDDPVCDEGVDSEDVEEDIDRAPALPIGGRHEDRPDAFDYEHLFLHSGMGTLSRQGRSRSSSHSSMYSIETTKPSNFTAEASEVDTGTSEDLSEPLGIIHERKGSVESISTVATFATATEGKSSDEDGDEEEWVYKRPMAGSWEPDYASHHKGTVSKKEPPQQTIRENQHAVASKIPPMSQMNSVVNEHSNEKSRDVTQSSEQALPDLLAFLTFKLTTKDGGSSRPIELNDSDRDLAERLVRSMAQVCSQLQAFSMDGNKYGGRPWRRRLDSARRLLDGETNGEVF